MKSSYAPAIDTRIQRHAPEHQAQVINYLNASGIEIGLLINFGNPKLDYRRLTRNRKPSVDEQK